MPPGRADRLRLATDYPYAAPRWDMLFRDGRVTPLAQAAEAVDYAGRVPVLAHGSNRAPAQLARKFHDFPGALGTIPVTYIWLHDHDVVYSAHLTRYGAVASTLWPAPGTVVRVAVTWLDPAQLTRMHATEGNYGFGRLDGVPVTPAARHPHAPAADDLAPGPAMYLSENGALSPAGTPWALAAVPAWNRRLPGRTQGQVQEALRRRIAPTRGFESFILDAVEDSSCRRWRNRYLVALQSHACLPAFRPVFSEV